MPTAKELNLQPGDKVRTAVPMDTCHHGCPQYKLGFENHPVTRISPLDLLEGEGPLYRVLGVDDRATLLEYIEGADVAVHLHFHSLSYRAGYHLVKDGSPEFEGPRSIHSGYAHFTRVD